MATLKQLNDTLSHQSYLSGYQPSQADTTAFDQLKSAPGSDLPYVLRWYNHIKSFGDLRKQFPAASGNTNAPATAAADDDDVDLFGDDDEEDADAAKVREQRLAEYAAKKSKKPALVAKSNVILDIKPWDDETDMAVLEQEVRKITMDGLLWGTGKLVPLAYDIKKLQISTVVEDDKVSVDELTEKITELEDYVQSVDIAAFNKI